MTIFNSLIRRYRYSGTLGLVALIIIIPMGIMGYLLYTEVDDNLQILTAEQLGLNYIAKTRPLIQLIPQHRGMSAAYLKGDESFLQKITQHQHSIDQK